MNREKFIMEIGPRVLFKIRNTDTRTQTAAATVYNFYIENEMTN